MPRPRAAMRKVREVLRLSLGEGLSRRRVSAATGVPLTTIADCLARAAAAQLEWPLPEGMDDAELERRLYPGQGTGVMRQRPEPDWAEVHRELRRKGMTLQLLWIEYKQRFPTATSTPSSFTATGSGLSGSTWCCARTIAPARSSSSTSPGTRCRSPIPSPAR
jgi:hypothetical protein